MKTRLPVSLAAVVLAATFPACGGGGGNPVAPPPPPPPPVPAAAVSAFVEGTLVLHPSLDRRYVVAMETPVRVQETAGGSANWAYARLTFFLRGRSIETAQVAGISPVTARSNRTHTLLFRFNSADFDALRIELGMQDHKDSRLFTVNAVLNYSDVAISPFPMVWSPVPR
jgi:hypothetical protein